MNFINKIKQYMKGNITTTNTDSDTDTDLMETELEELINDINIFDNLVGLKEDLKKVQATLLSIYNSNASIDIFQAYEELTDIINKLYD